VLTFSLRNGADTTLRKPAVTSTALRQLVRLGRHGCSARLLRAEALEGGLAGHTEDIADVRPRGPAVKGGVHRVTEGNSGRLERC
jgi:hypothetical protein